jgi:hypothetical protein
MALAMALALCRKTQVPVGGAAARLRETCKYGPRGLLLVDPIGD